MELPKNITQIGEADPRSKIYAEDYVVSYMKQMNEKAENKPVGMAFYGTKREIGEKIYYFFYGASRLSSIAKEVTHLSGAQRQEIEKIRQAHFKDYEFLGYHVLEGNLVEGFFLYEQGIGRYVSGYAQFSEKNDTMLTFMMDHKEEESEPEVVDQAKYVEVKERQEKRREEAIYHYKQNKKQQGLALKYGTVACAAALGLLLYRNWDNPMVKQLYGQGKEFATDAKHKMEELVSGQAESVATTPEGVQSVTKTKDILVAEDNLNQALLEENDITKEANAEAIPQVQRDVEDTQEAVLEEITVETPQEDITEDIVNEEQVAETSAVVDPKPAYYVVQKGDTLISICNYFYGNKDRVYEICQMNGISDPDNIQEGWKILLP